MQFWSLTSMICRRLKQEDDTPVDSPTVNRRGRDPTSHLRWVAVSGPLAVRLHLACEVNYLKRSEAPMGKDQLAQFWQLNSEIRPQLGAGIEARRSRVGTSDLSADISHMHLVACPLVAAGATGSRGESAPHEPSLVRIQLPVSPRRDVR